MSFFKKKRLNDVEGYNRMSRLVDDRHRELGEQESGLDDLKEDTVLLAPQLRPGLPGQAPREPLQQQPDAESVTVRRAPMAPVPQFEPPARLEQPQPYAQAASQPFAPAVAPIASAPAPRMPAPELQAMSGTLASLVAKDAVWNGKLTSTGDIRIEGRLEGEVQTTGTLFVAAEARVHGTVKARNAMLAGEIDGELRCEDRLEILPGGSARGDIDTGTLVVHEGAFIESKFQMHREGSAVRT